MELYKKSVITAGIEMRRSSGVKFASLFLLFTLAGVNRGNAAGEYQWPAYSPTVAYDYEEDFGDVDPPTQQLIDVTGVEGIYADGWWSFVWGSNKNAAVTAADWVPMIERLNEDFAYITDIMRWPRDLRARSGYYSTVYLFGSGLSTDSASNTDTGGWQGTTWYNGQNWPMILASYYPVHCFDPTYFGGDKGYQTGAMVHEGIHSILASLPGCFNSAWFHEGGNTWLQGTMDAQRSGDFSGIGWLSAGSAIAPFMPIECYTGWLQDGSFGGPSAEGVNMFNGTQQICTWRNLLGGVQYSECFPHALEVILGAKSVAWVWRNCDDSGRVLQDLAEDPNGIGAAQTRRLIQEYRARQAFCDFGPWSYAFQQLLNGNWGVTIQEDWSPFWIDVDPWTATCYAATTNSGGVLTPDALTLPGWSGANQIPLTVNPAATNATVTFNPLGANMSCQLVYRDTSGNVHYGEPVSSGVCSIPLSAVRSSVIVAVVCNTDYSYQGESSRTTKYNYTLTMGDGITGKANIYTKWYNYNPASHIITASAQSGGTISPSGSVSVNAGASRTFTFTPDPGYEVDEVILNGFPIGSMSSYTLNPVRGDHTIEVSFRDAAPTAPAAPTSLQASANSGSQIHLEWLAPADTDSYVVQRSDSSGGPYTTIASGITNTVFIDSGLATGATYYYIVSAENAVGESPFSAEVRGDTALTVGEWNFDQNLSLAGTGLSANPAQDVTGNSNTMYVTSSSAGATYSAQGSTPSGSGLSLEANGAKFSYLNSTTTRTWNPETWTIEASVVMDDLGLWETFIGKNGSSLHRADSDFYLQKTDDFGDIRVALTTVSGQRVTVNSAYYPTVGQWFHLAVTSDGKKVSLYINDGTGWSRKGFWALTGGSAASNALSNGNGTIWVFLRGWWNNTLVDYVDGRMDNIRFSEGALSPDAFLYDGGLTMPDTPTGLVASAVSADEIGLSWSASADAAGYYIKRSTSPGGPYSIVGETSGTTFSDTGLTAGVTYYYVISAISDNAQGSASAEAGAVPSGEIALEEYRIAGHGIEDGTNLSLTVSNSVPGHNYGILATDTLTPSAWSNIMVEAGTGSNLLFGIPIDPTSTTRYFKLDVQRQ